MDLYKPPTFSITYQQVEEVKEDDKVDEGLEEIVEVVEDDKVDGVGDTPPVIVKKPPVITPPKSPPNETIEKLKGNQITIKELKELAKTSDLKISAELYLEFFKKSIENQQGSYEILYNKIKKDKILKDSKLKTYLGKVSMSGETAQRLRTTIDGKKVNRLKTLKEFENIINKD